MLALWAATTINLKVAAVFSIIVMVGVFEHPRESTQRPWTRGLQGEYISYTHSNAMEAFIIE